MSKRLVTGSAPTATIGGGDTINQNQFIGTDEEDLTN